MQTSKEELNCIYDYTSYQFNTHTALKSQSNTAIEMSNSHVHGMYRATQIHSESLHWEIERYQNSAEQIRLSRYLHIIFVWIEAQVFICSSHFDLASIATILALLMVGLDVYIDIVVLFCANRWTALLAIFLSPDHF